MKLANKPPLATNWKTIAAAGSDIENAIQEFEVPASLTLTFERWDGNWIVELRLMGGHQGWLAIPKDDPAS